MHPLAPPSSAQARLSYLGISAFLHTRTLPLSCTRHSSSASTTGNGNGTYRRSDFSNQGFTGFYDADAPTEGPLRTAPTPPRVTPSALKSHLDAFVVGQDRAKRVLSTAVYNHYQRIQEMQRREDEEAALLAQEERKRMALHPRHPVEDEFPGQAQTMTNDGTGNPTGWISRSNSHFSSHQEQQQSHDPLHDPTPLIIEKSNVLLLGPTGVGKTLMARTLARVLQVPISISDCTPFTQAGYIGEDADACVARLLAAANYDVAKCERGIIVLDELDKIATARVSHGKDVSGEGVQQALLKIIEGTTVQVQAKSERSSGTQSSSTDGRRAGQGWMPAGNPTNSPLSSGGIGTTGNVSSGQKGEIYNVKTDSILFICAGAFNGLHKIILDRINKGSIGFNAPVRAAASSSSDSPNAHETVFPNSPSLFAKHLPYYTPSQHTPEKSPTHDNNTLALALPPDLRAFGLIPELIGRLPITCALSPLSTTQLLQVLTEPRHSLLKQYTHLFALSHMELRVTTPALHAIATRAAALGTGARGLRTVMEGVLGDAMFEFPGTNVRYVVVGEAAGKGEEGVWGFTAAEGERVGEVVENEEEGWRRKETGVMGSFEEYREKVGAAG